MKNLKRTLAIVTAIAAMLAAVPAFADLEANVIDKDDNITVTHNVLGTSSPTVTVTATNATDEEMTFLILDDDTDVTNIGESDILYIDQQAGATSKTFTGVINLGRVAKVIAGTAPDAALPDGDYPIWLGYTDATTDNFRIAKATLKVAEKSSGTVVSIVWGDVDASGSVGSTDIEALIMRAIGGQTTFTNKTTSKSFTIGTVYDGIVWGDVDASGSVGSTDIEALIMRAIGGQTTFTSKTTSKSYTIGNSYEIVLPE